MHVFKPTFVLVALSLVVAAETTVSSADQNVEFHPGKPAKPLFACVVKSRSCRSTTTYTDLTYDNNLKLGVCHHDSLAKNIWNYISLSSHRGVFFNTFYGYCADHDVACELKSALLKPNEYAHVLEDQINKDTECEAFVQCYHPDQVDDQCFPKKKSE